MRVSVVNQPTASSEIALLPDDDASRSRNVHTGSNVNLRIAHPAVDGTVVDASYLAKIYFDKSLGTAISDAQLIGEFTLTLDGTLIPGSSYSIIRNETATESALAFQFPNFYTGNPDDLHELRAVHQRGDITLSDTRDVKAAPGAIVDSDGDGLPDYWENQNSLDPNNPDGDEGAGSDKDGDGVSAILEFLADFNPADPNDGRLLTPIVSPFGATKRLQFPVIANRRYQVETTTDFVSWGNAGASFTVTTANPTYLWTDPSGAVPNRFYRVRISLP